MPRSVPQEIIGYSVTSKWSEAEEPLGVRDFPIALVPPERRTVIASTAATLFSSGMVLRDRFADLLGVTPVEDVEQVLDYFELDIPILEDGG
jgi:hypothetical protein